MARVCSPPVPTRHDTTRHGAFREAFYCGGGAGLSPSWPPPCAWPPARCSAPPASSWRGCASPPAGERGVSGRPGPGPPGDPRPPARPPYPLLDELERALVLRHLEQLHGAPLVRGEAAHLADHVAHELGVLGQALRGRASAGRLPSPRPCPRGRRRHAAASLLGPLLLRWADSYSYINHARPRSCPGLRPSGADRRHRGLHPRSAGPAARPPAAAPALTPRRRLCLGLLTFLVTLWPLLRPTAIG